jgi:hypothetical protein
MTAIHLQAPHGDWRRVSHRPRRTSRLVERALAAVRDWRRRRRDRLQIAALDARISRDIKTRRSDPLDLDRPSWREQLKRCDLRGTANDDSAVALSGAAEVNRGHLNSMWRRRGSGNRLPRGRVWRAWMEAVQRS